MNYRIAQAVRDSDIELVTVAGRPQMTDVDLQRKRSEEPSIWPTDDIRPVPLTEPEQLMDALPEDAILDDETFWNRYAQGELTAIQPFQEVKEYPLLAIVLDGSPSMDSNGPAMRNGFKRNVVARGIAANLLLRAMDGNTRFLFRYFDTNPRKLEVVDTADEAQKLIERLTNGFEEAGGTDVAAGFKQTVADIRARGGEWTRAEIVLISDCEDNNLSPEALAAEIKGENIRFHVAQVGVSSDSLRKVATSYREFL